MSLPQPIISRVRCASAIGFSGSRSVVPPVMSSLLCLVSRSPSPVLVGCATGVDAAVRASFPASRLQVFSVAPGSGRGAFAARSISFVQAVYASDGVLFSFPSSVCPVGLSPSRRSDRCFCGSGSGTWASLAFAIPHGICCFVYLGSLPAPVGWGLSSIGGGWFWAYVPAPSQLTLF